MNIIDIKLKWNILRRFVFYLLHLNVKQSSIIDIINYFKIKDRLDQNIVNKLINSIKHMNPFPASMTYLDYLNWIHSIRHEKTMSKFKNSEFCYFIFKALPFSDKKTLMNVLLINKDIYKLLKSHVFRVLLINRNSVINPKHRINIWSQILELNDFNFDYEELKSISAANPELQDNIKNIKLDTTRSLKDNMYVDKDVLTNMLISFSAYNKTIGYCQGLNYVVCYLYLLLKDESTIFKFMVILIEKYNLEELYTKNVPLLKRNLYIMKKLIAEYYPTLNECIDKNCQSIDFFVSVWFVTLFTYSIKDLKTQAPNLILIKIWDAFLTNGWKAIFKVGVYIMKRIKERLEIGKTIDLQILLQSFPTNEFLQDNANINGMMDFFNNTKITNSMLENIGQEYDNNRKGEKQEENKGWGKSDKKGYIEKKSIEDDRSEISQMTKELFGKEYKAKNESESESSDD